MLSLVCIVSGLPFHEARAHDPGLSIAEMKQRGDSLSVHLSYARGDIEQLLPLDLDHDEKVSQMEFENSYQKLIVLSDRLVSISQGGESLAGENNFAELDESDAVHFTMEFTLKSGSELTIRSPLINKLALGHRQHITLIAADKRVSSGFLSARNPVYSILLQESQRWQQFENYLVEGIWHIWIGYDHILFVIALLLPACYSIRNGVSQIRDNFRIVSFDVLKIISAFTIAHSITLVLTALEIIEVPGRLVESVIAASVIVAALNNIFVWKQGKLWSVVFLFGLIHGMGFASVLDDIGLPQQSRTLSLIAFNIGIEMGQIAIVSVVLPLIFILRKTAYYEWAIIKSGSWCISLVAGIWLAERLADIDLISWM